MGGVGNSKANMFITVSGGQSRKKRKGKEKRFFFKNTQKTAFGLHPESAFPDIPTLIKRPLQMNWLMWWFSSILSVLLLSLHDKCYSHKFSFQKGKKCSLSCFSGSVLYSSF